MRQGHVGRHVDTPGETRQRPWKVAAPADLGAFSLTRAWLIQCGLSYAWDLPHPQMQPLKKRRDPFQSIEFISRGGE